VYCSADQNGPLRDLGHDAVADFGCRRAIAAVAAARCASSWKKIAERYCVPSSTLAIQSWSVVLLEELEQLLVRDLARNRT